MAKKPAKKTEAAIVDRNRFNMKIVTSDTCAVCKTPCARGMRYYARMQEPGAVGNGVACILTKGRAYK